MKNSKIFLSVFLALFATIVVGAAGDRLIYNPTSNADMYLQVTKAGSLKTVFKGIGSSGNVILAPDFATVDIGSDASGTQANLYLRAGAANGSIIRLFKNGVAEGQMGAVGSVNENITGSAAGDMFFYAAIGNQIFSTNASRIEGQNASGVWTFGGTTYPAAAHIIQNQVSGGTQGTLEVINRDGGGGSDANGGLFIRKVNSSTTTANIFARFFVNTSTGSGLISANGASTAAFGSFSDRRLKQNIKTIPSQLGKIMSLRPVEFDYKDGSGHQTGFVAQEMETVYPDVVSTEYNSGYLTITGWDKTDARLVSAIQELERENQALRAKVSKIEERLDAAGL